MLVIFHWGYRWKFNDKSTNRHSILEKEIGWMYYLYTCNTCYSSLPCSWCITVAICQYMYVCMYIFHLWAMFVSYYQWKSKMNPIWFLWDRIYWIHYFSLCCYCESNVQRTSACIPFIQIEELYCIFFMLSSSYFRDKSDKISVVNLKDAGECRTLFLINIHTMFPYSDGLQHAYW